MRAKTHVVTRGVWAVGCKSILALGILWAALTPARGELITSAGQMPQAQGLIDFSQFADPNGMVTMGPVTVGPGVTFTSTNPAGSILGNGPYSLNDNGIWDSAITFAGLDTDQFGIDTYTMTFTFSSPVAAVGGLMNYAAFQFSGFSPVVISTLDSSGNTLESYYLCTSDPDQPQPPPGASCSYGISTPGELDTGSFVGIVSDQDDIYGFSLSNSAVLITDLTYSNSTPTPEPATILLSLVGALAVLLFHLQRSQSALSSLRRTFEPPRASDPIRRSFSNLRIFRKAT